VRLVCTVLRPDRLRAGFSAEGEPRVAACLLPGTEVVFERDVERVEGFSFPPALCCFRFHPNVYGPMTCEIRIYAR
jgi:hypothetical protein